MTHPTRVQAYLTAFAKTAGRKFDHKGRPVLASAELLLLTQAQHLDATDDFKRHVSVTMQLARLEVLDREVG